jgi:hypothetical protein
VTTCFIAEAMDGAFCLKLSAVRPLTAVCNSANAAFTCSTLGWRTGEAEASAASRLLFTLAIAVFSAATPSCEGFTFVSASSDDLSAATSSQAAAVGAVVVGGGRRWCGRRGRTGLARRARAAAPQDAEQGNGRDRSECGSTGTVESHLGVLPGDGGLGALTQDR